MKKVCYIIFLLISLKNFAQLGAKSFVPSRVLTTAAGQFDTSALPTFGLYGIGNTNTETFQNLNSSGKVSGYIRPYKSTIKGIPFYAEINFSFNTNATNTDSLTVNTVLFPDVGKNSFSSSLTLNFIFNGTTANDFYFVSPFFEFSNKTIEAKNLDVSRKFYTINSTLGLNFQYLYKNNTDRVSFTISPYFAVVDIPEPGVEDYRFLFTGNEDSQLKNSIKSFGVKPTFQYNNFQIYADFRSVRGEENDYPVEDMCGFHPNIGVTFNAAIFEQ